MNQKTKWLALVAALVVVLAAGTFLYQRLQQNYLPGNLMELSTEQGDLEPQAGSEAEPAEDAAADEPFAAMDFTVVDSNGNEVMLSDFFGTPIVLNFWASWCPPCRQEMPEFQQAFETYGEDVQFMMVDLVSSQEPQANGEAYIAEQGYTFPVFYDTAQDAAYTYGIRSIPTSIFIDGDGNIAAVAQGAIDMDTLQRGIAMITPQPDA